MTTTPAPTCECERHAMDIFMQKTSFNVAVQWAPFKLTAQKHCILSHHDYSLRSLFDLFAAYDIDGRRLESPSNYDCQNYYYYQNAG